MNKDTLWCPSCKREFPMLAASPLLPGYDAKSLSRCPKCNTPGEPRNGSEKPEGKGGA